MSSILFEPTNIAGLELKNRLVRSATAEAMATPDGRPTPQLKDLYCALAQGEVGLIITSGAAIESWVNPPETIGIRAGLAMHDDRFIDDWPEIIQAVHERGANIAMQYGYLGRQDIPQLRGAAPLAPSAVPIEATGVTPQAMTQADIMDVVEKFAQAARRIKEAGFDAAQIHGAHGNLVTNFMSPFTNRRQDEYGGSAENRARFVNEVIQRTRELVGPDFPIMIKLSFSDFVDNGLDPDEAVQMAAIMADSGIDCIEVSGGTLSETPDRISVKNIKRPEQEAYFLSIAKALKKQVDIPVMLVGGLRTPEVLEKALQDGAADLLSLCRPLIREPGLVGRWKQGDRTKATCVSCNTCFTSWMFAPLRCFLDEPLEKEEKPEDTCLP
jgi:2,4-dienoyl-CoA reductase-like NADH-dependent reductase (Old Yellow Enzyme family)